VIMDERRLMRMTNSVEWYQPVGRPLEQKYTGTWKLWAANTEGRDAYQSTIKRGCVVMANIQVNRSGLIAPQWDRRSGPDRLHSCKFGAQLSRKLRELDDNVTGGAKYF
jgi:hypothetical protein